VKKEKEYVCTGRKKEEEERTRKKKLAPSI
jgi:hypothetical protein